MLLTEIIVNHQNRIKPHMLHVYLLKIKYEMNMKKTRFVLMVTNDR